MNKLSPIFSDINLIVISEKIITNKPMKKVKNFNFKYWELSLDDIISKNGISIKIGI